jgi:uncharacterized integral membrane protein
MADSDKKRRIDQWRVGAIVAGILLLWFAIGNLHSVNVSFWLTTVHAPVIVVIVASAALGTLATTLWRRARKPH